MDEARNPYVVGKPVSNEEMFFGREDVFEFIRRNLRGEHRDNVLVLYGQRRSGKTSILEQMGRRLESGYVCALISLHAFSSDRLDRFLLGFANEIVRALRGQYRIDVPRPDPIRCAQDPHSYFRDDFLPRVLDAIGPDRNLLLMLDEAVRLQEQVQAGALTPDVFGYMRFLMQHYARVNFLFSLGSGVEAMRKDYAMLFSVGLYKKVSFLDRDSAVRLIVEPVHGLFTQVREIDCARRTPWRTHRRAVQPQGITRTCVGTTMRLSIEFSS